MTTPLDTSTEAVERRCEDLMEWGGQYDYDLTELGKKMLEEAASVLRALAKERDELHATCKAGIRAVAAQEALANELEAHFESARKERDEARADYEQSVDSMQTITERCKFAIEAADAKRDAALAQVAELREELNEARKHEALSIRREKTARKFWIRDAKESLAGKPAALRNRVELCELPPVRGETCPVDGMPLLVFEEAKREEDDLVAALAKVAELRTALEFYANPEIYKPHPHGPAFDRRDVSYRARAALASTEEKK